MTEFHERNATRKLTALIKYIFTSSSSYRSLDYLTNEVGVFLSNVPLESKSYEPIRKAGDVKRCEEVAKKDFRMMVVINFFTHIRYQSLILLAGIQKENHNIINFCRPENICTFFLPCLYFA